MASATDCLFRLSRTYWPFFVFIALYLLDLLVDLVSPLQPTVSGFDWLVLVAALLPYIHAWIVWVLYIGDALVGIVRADAVLTPPRKVQLTINVGLIYILTLLQNAAIYSAIARLDRDAFVGIDTDSITGIGRIALSLFLAVETIAALGTGAIFANAASVGGFLPIALNSVQSLLFTGIVLSKLASFVTANQEERLLRILVREIRANNREQAAGNNPERLQAIKFQ